MGDRRRARAAVLLLTLLTLLAAAVPVLAVTPSDPVTPAATAPAASVPPPETTASRAASVPAPETTASPAATGAPPETGAATAANPCPAPTPAPGATPDPHEALCPAQPKGADPFSLLAWLFTPIFQALFLGLMVAYMVLGDIGLAIIVLTVLIRILLVPVFRAQMVSQRRMQLIQPELRVIQQKYKGNRAKISEEQLRLYRDRGVNPAAGCLPALLQFALLIPMYSVFSRGLLAWDISAMLQVFGIKVLDVPCQSPGNTAVPCIDTAVAWLGGLDASKPEVLFTTGITVLGFPLGLSSLALISAALQLIQTRMMTPATDDPQVRTQQRIFLLFPLFSLLYGVLLPAGLFIYWIVTTVFSIVQQYLVTGWGGLFPLFGWTPAFARDHQPRYPIAAMSPPKNGDRQNEPPPTRRTATDSAAGTVRPARSRGRTSRRGRRR